MAITSTLAMCAIASIFAELDLGRSVKIGEKTYYRYEWRVNSFGYSAQASAALEVGPGGDITAVWDSRRQQGGRYGVYSQRFTAEGVALGGETAVNLWRKSHQMLPATAGDGSGNTWVVWQSYGQDGHRGAIIAR